ncbi:MAG: DUF1080 domain-containing protein [Isosphaeraceae bacterium]
MRIRRSVRGWGGLAALGCCLALLLGAADGDEQGFVNLLNGKDLSGWRIGKNPGGEVLEGKTASSDGRFRAADGAVVIQGAAKIEDIYTTREFNKPFTLRLEFRAEPKANSGLYLRGTQLQVRDYSSIGPYKDLKTYKTGEWNALEIVVTVDPSTRASVARCTCNGELLEAALKIAEKGGIGLQSETNRIEYRRIRIKEAE